MKIKALVTFWKRPEITRIFLDRFKAIKPDYADVELIPIISPEDPFFNANKAMMTGYDYLVYKNLPLGEKRNAGLKYLKDYDYVLDLGSDNFFTSLLWDNYRQYLGKCEFLGLKNIYFYDIINEKAIFVRNYATGNHTSESFGAGRMIRRDVIEKLQWLWKNEWNSGLDGISRQRMIANGVKETVIDTGEAPVMLDVKTNTNIHHFMTIEHRREKYVDVAEVRNMFDLQNVSLTQQYVFTWIPFEGFRGEVCRRSQTMSVKDAFNSVNQEYAVNFGTTRYKNYDSYKNQVSQRLKK